MNIQIRLIEPRDNTPLAKLIVEVSSQYAAYKVNYTVEHPSLQDLYGDYQQSGARYWVLEDLETGEILGGLGFMPLKGLARAERVCEMQKFYLSDKVRGMGFGKKLMQLVLSQASRLGYRQIYLETAPFMASAVALYEKMGFQRLPERLGNTANEPNITLFMSRSLQEVAPSSNSAVQSASSVKTKSHGHFPLTVS